MADIAIGIECPTCATLTAVSGSRTDKDLVGRCALGHPVSMANPNRVDPPAHGACCKCFESEPDVAVEPSEAAPEPEKGESELNWTPAEEAVVAETPSAEA